MSRRRYLKTAVLIDEYAAICQRADVEGLSLAGYLRAALLRDVERQSLADSVRAALPATPVVAAPDVTPAVQEVLQLVRLLASQANPQAAARITAAIKQQHRL